MDDPESIDDKLDHLKGSLPIHGLNDHVDNHLGSGHSQSQRAIEEPFACNHSEYRQSVEMESDSYPLSNSQSLSLRLNLKQGALVHFLNWTCLII